MMPASNQGVGMNMGFPDVCTTPMAPAPIPVPYPNIGMNAMSVPFVPTVMISMAPAHNMGSKPLMTNGDNAGVAHPMCMMPGGCMVGNPRILLGGLPAEHLAVPTYGNNFNNPLGAKTVPSITNVLLSDLSTVDSPTCAWGSVARELHGANPDSVGMTAVPDGDACRVVHVQRGGPAHRAGIRVRDRVLDVDDVPAASMPNWPRLRSGHDIALRVVRERAGRASARSVHLRAARDAALQTAWLPGRVGLIAIRRFSVRLPTILRDQAQGFLASGVRAIVLDLRGNAGGSVRAAVDAAGLFLGCERAVAQVSVGGARRCLRPRLSGPTALRRLPLVLAVDALTASAAEVFAASVADRGRALVVGQTTFGKGIGQAVTSTATHATPMGRPVGVQRADGSSYHRSGVAPDIGSDSDGALAEAWRIARRRSREVRTTVPVASHDV